METHLPNKFHHAHERKVMWLCTMGKTLMKQRTDLVAQHLKFCFGNSEMLEQSLPSKYLCIIILYDCVSKQQVST